MKKLCTALLAAVMLLSLAGCGADAPDLREENFSFNYNGIQIVLGAEAAPVIDALGEPESCTEEPSCAFDGMDKTYYFGSFYLTTCPLEGKDYVYSVWFVDDSAATNEGVHIGSTRAEAEAAYGTGCFHGTNAYTQTAGNSKRTIILTEGSVSSIQYEMVME